MIKSLFREREYIILLEGRSPVVSFKEGPELELMKKIRSEKCSEEFLQKTISDLFSLVESKDKSGLPVGPDEKLISDWLVAVRLSFLNQKEGNLIVQQSLGSTNLFNTL